MNRWPIGLPALPLIVVTLATACAEPGHDQSDIPTVTVLAAASLTESFQTLAESFEESHPGTTVRLAFDSSATLAGQVAGGAPTDVLATADEQTMRDAKDSGAIDGEVSVFATNRLVLVAPADNPAQVRGLDGLVGATFVVCVPTAPCGAVAEAVLADARDTPQAGDADPLPQPASLEPDVKAVLAKVVADEADAGLVYATDALAAGDGIVAFEIPRATDHLTTYPVAVAEQSRHPELARQFLDLVVSDQGQAVLEAAGFGPPPERVERPIDGPSADE